MEKKILAGFSGEDFNDATSSRFDGGDGSFPENLQEKKLFRLLQRDNMTKLALKATTVVKSVTSKK